MAGLQDCRIAERKVGRAGFPSCKSLLQSCHPAILQFDRALDLFYKKLLQRVDAACRRAARGVLVAAAAEFLRDRADVDLALRPHADAVDLALDLLEEHDGLDLLH